MKYIALLLIYCVWANGVVAKPPSDTTELIKLLNRLLVFSSNQYVYYNTNTVLSCTPILQPEDTAKQQGVFFKVEDDFYYYNHSTEMFAQDSLWIMVNHDHKTILINKANAALKERMNALPLTDEKIKEMVQRNFIIVNKEVNKNLHQISLTSKTGTNDSAFSNQYVTIDYDSKSMLPRSFQFGIELSQLINENDLQQVIDADPDNLKMIQLINGRSWLIRKQQMQVYITDYTTNKEQALKMPHWGKILIYDYKTDEYVPKDQWADYEITKTF